LGAGKTCLTQGLAEGLGCREAASSPTFTLVHEYSGGRLPLYHIDLYRLEPGAVVRRLGLEEYFEGEGVSVVEWPERLEGAPPGARLIRMRHQGGAGRSIEIEELP
jgi:tRNA threonylcarbamoyladenosine biosynthesis protein TsaE